MKIRVSWGLFFHTNECFGESACGIVKESKSAGCIGMSIFALTISMHGRYCRPRCRTAREEILPTFPMDGLAMAHGHRSPR
jgi:hypothetical protein